MCVGGGSVFKTLAPPRGDPWAASFGFSWRKLYTWVTIMMASLDHCSSAETLDHSQGEPSISAHRAIQMGEFSRWYVASWNI